ncbi:hypothetical protein BBJ28_00001408 [Nothophytophthora sp. Chile5]|nr:hypothetical protein BBJ28_00001408 [Nothophytophthora sp. Chile5]
MSSSRGAPSSSSRASSHRSSRSGSDRSPSRCHRASDELSLASTCDDQPRLNLPLDKEFLPLENPTEDEQERVRDDVRDEILIPYESIRELEKTTTMMFQHAIRLATFDKDEYTFTSFWGNNRDNCYDLILKTRDRVLREVRPTAETSSSSRFPALPTSPVSRDSASSVDSTPSELEAAAEQQETDASELPTDDAAADNDAVDVVADDEADDNAELAQVLRRRSVVSDVDSIAPKDISMTQIVEEKFPVSVDTFMQTFFLDDAPFGMDTFGERTGSTEMTINPWMTPLEEEASFGMTRSLQFRVPIEAPIGPKSSQVDVLQCLKESEHNMRVVESSTRLVDIPYGDYFSVEDRWTIVPHASDPNACKLFIELKVVFGKSTFWKKTIEARAISDNKAKWQKWVGMAKEFVDSGAHVVPVASPPTSSTSSEKALPMQDADRKNRGSPAKRRSKAGHRHREAVASANVPSRQSRASPVKLFPWILVLVLLFIVVRLQMALSSIERSLVLNTELVGEMQRQLVGLQVGACPSKE